MAKQASKSKITRSFIYLFISVVLIGLTIRSGLDVLHTRTRLKELEEEKVQLEKERDTLAQEVEELNDDDYIIKYARDHYIFSKDGEEVVVLPED